MAWMNGMINYEVDSWADLHMNRVISSSYCQERWTEKKRMANRQRGTHTWPRACMQIAFRTPSDKSTGRPFQHEIAVKNNNSCTNYKIMSLLQVGRNSTHLFSGDILGRTCWIAHSKNPDALRNISTEARLLSEKWMESQNLITIMQLTRTTVAEICKCTSVALKR